MVLDLLQVALGAGCTPYRALELTARWGPPAAGAAFGTALDATQVGSSLGDALSALAVDAPTLAPVTDVLLASDRLGAPAGPALTRLAHDVRADLRRRAEARARTLPVKLLFPLVFLVLPAFGLLTVVPALLTALAHLSSSSRLPPALVSELLQGGPMLRRFLAALSRAFSSVRSTTE